jgi:hypothetical protein
VATATVGAGEKGVVLSAASLIVRESLRSSQEQDAEEELEQSSPLAPSDTVLTRVLPASGSSSATGAPCIPEQSECDLSTGVTAEPSRLP